MTRALFRTLRADLRSHRLQSALIVLMLFAAGTALTLAVTIRRGTDAPYDRAFAHANGAHVWFYGRDAAVDFAPIATMAGVAGTAGPYPVAFPGVSVPTPFGHTLREELQLRGMPAELPDVGRPLITEGRWLRDAGAGEVVLDRNYARDRRLGIGGRVEVTTPAGTRSLVIVGLALDIGRGPYPLWDPPLAYVLPESLAAIEPRPDRVVSVYGVRLADPESVERFTNDAFSRYPAGTLRGTDDWQEVRADINEGNDIYSVLLGVFSVFALGAAGFVIANVIGGRVLAQFREIGLLKAIGVTPGQVVLLFLVEHLALALVATVLGIAAAAALAPRFLNSTAELLNTTPASAFDPSVALLVLVGVAAVVALFTLIPAWQGGRIAPVQAITVGFARVQRRPSRPARLAVRLGLPLTLVLGVKDTFARPLRAVLTVAALSRTVVTATFTVAMDATLDEFVADPGILGDPFPMGVLRGPRPDAELRALLAGIPGVSAVYGHSQMPASAPGRADSIQIRALEEPYDQFRFPIREGRLFAAPGEAVAGQGLLAMLGVTVGDEIELSVDGRPLVLRIVGRYIEDEEDGRTAMFSMETLRRQIDPQALPTAYGLRLTPGADRDAVRTAIQQAGGGTGGEPLAVITYSDDTEVVNLIRGILAGLNGVLLVIGLVNLLTTALLGVRERLRDIGILKAVGLTPGQVMLTVVAGGVLLAVLAGIVGIPLGLAVTRVLFDALGRQTGLGAGLGAMPGVIPLLLLLPAVVLLAALASALPARRAAAVQVAGALRYE